MPAQPPARTKALAECGRVNMRTRRRASADSVAGRSVAGSRVRRHTAAGMREEESGVANSFLHTGHTLDAVFV